MATIERRKQFLTALLRLRHAQALADDALILYWANITGAVDKYHLAEVERRCDETEQAIVGFRLELQAQRSRISREVVV
jgi:hypothetical protein